MADLEFEEFEEPFLVPGPEPVNKRSLQLPSLIRDGGTRKQQPSHAYKLVHAITPLEENTSFLEKIELAEKLFGIKEEECFHYERSTSRTSQGDIWASCREGWKNSPPFDVILRQSRATDGGSDSEADGHKPKRRNCSQPDSHSLSESEDRLFADEEYDIELNKEKILNDHISNEDRTRIIETNRTLLESLKVSEDSHPQSANQTIVTDSGEPESDRAAQRPNQLVVSSVGHPQPDCFQKSSRDASEGHHDPDRSVQLEAASSHLLDHNRQRGRNRTLMEPPEKRQSLDVSPLVEKTSSIFDELSAATPSWEKRGFCTASDQSAATPLPSCQLGAFAKILSPSCALEEDDDFIQKQIMTARKNLVRQHSFRLNLYREDGCEEDIRGCDADSGNSTTHSPEELTSRTHQRDKGSDSVLSPISPSLASSSRRLELLDPTHRGLHRFVPRHSDEIEIDIGDPVYVQKEGEDLWCEGINLRTGKQGIFPEAHVVDVDYNDFDPMEGAERKERYILDYLATVRCRAHKGTEVITQAVKRTSSLERVTCVLEIGEKGIKLVEKNKAGTIVCGDPQQEYYFNLKHVTFCGFHPRDHRYFAFITKHPSPWLDQYACHVLVSDTSTRCVAEAFGRAFHRFYKTFVETAFPTEDIYLE